MLIDDDDDCFLCRPEAWRTVYDGRLARAVAGAGPLCPGYVLVAPKQHLSTSAALPTDVWIEFQVISALLVRALQRNFGPGYTAYEHGRIGSCSLLETKGDHSTFCHHAHRVFVPRHTSCSSDIARWFERSHVLAVPSSLREYSGAPYVYYETGNGMTSSATAFVGDRGIPAQFMRRVLTTALRTGRDWNWKSNLRLDEMIRTVSLLTADFVGLPTQEESVRSVGALPEGSVSIDGFSCTGKTAIGRSLSRAFGWQLVDTGIAFRRLALARVRRHLDPDAKALFAPVPTDGTETDLRSPEVTAVAATLAANSDIRRMFHAAASHVISKADPTIVIGRDAWKMVGGEALNMLVEADIETRVARRALQLAADCHEMSELSDIRRSLLSQDHKDIAKLPPLNLRDLVVVQNGRRPLCSVVAEAESAVRGNQ